MKVLTIGNSFSGNATVFLNDMAKRDEGVDLTVVNADLGGCSLEKHWNLVEQCDMLPEVKPYSISVRGAEAVPMTLRDALVHLDWDFITLQQVSSLSWKPESYAPYIDQLRKLIGELAPRAVVLIHQTWAYRIDARAFFEKNGLNQATMFERLVDAYDTHAKRLGCRIIPSGTAIQKARAELGFKIDENFDYENAKLWELPDQSGSLACGYHWLTGNTGTGKAELACDPNHLNERGCYIANAVWFEMFTGKSPNRNDFRPDGVGAEELGLFQRSARLAVEEYGGPLV